jgi:hypothetical protein
MALLSNLSSIYASEDIQKPTALNNFLALAQVRQHWNLFAPNPTHFSWSFSIFLQTQSGGLELTEAGLLPVRNDGKERLMFDSQRWKKAFSLFPEYTSSNWASLGMAFCRRASKAAIVREHFDEPVRLKLQFERTPKANKYGGSKGEYSLSCHATQS